VARLVDDPDDRVLHLLIESNTIDTLIGLYDRLGDGFPSFLIQSFGGIVITAKHVQPSLAGRSFCHIRQVVCDEDISGIQKVMRPIPNFINPKYFQIKFISVGKVLSVVLDGPLQLLHPCQENIGDSSKITSSHASVTSSKISFGLRGCRSFIQWFTVPKSQKSDGLRFGEYTRCEDRITFALSKAFVTFVPLWHIELSMCMANSARLFRRAKRDPFRLQLRNHLLNKINLVIFLSRWQSIQYQKLARCKKYREHASFVEISGLILTVTATQEEANNESD
jgi:hypothetical protein